MTNISSIARETIKSQIEALEKLSSNIDNSFEKSVDLLLKSELIILSGVGKSGYIAKKIVATLTSYGIKSVFLDPVEALHGDLGIATDKDTIILISKSGSTEELLKLFPYLKTRGLKVISITGNRNSFLSKNSDENLDISVEKESCPLNLAPTSSTTTSLVMGDALAAALVIKKNITANDFAINHPSGQLGKNQSLKVMDVMKKGDEIPTSNPKDTIKDAIVCISRFKLGATLVVTDNKVLGILTDGDIRRLLLKDIDINNTNIEDVMTKDPVNIDPKTLIGRALALMENRNSKISILPVVENSDLVGIISIHDIYGDTIG